MVLAYSGTVSALLAGCVVGLLIALLWAVHRQTLTTRALRESEERYRTIVQAANEGVWIIDHRGRTLYVNDRMARMLGYAPSEMLGRSALRFSFPKDRPFMKERLRSTLHGTPEQFDIRFRC